MQFDYSNVLEERIGRFGLQQSELINSTKILKDIKDQILKRKTYDYFALNLPGIMLKEVNEINSYGEYIKENFENFVVVGMGGSSLGNKMLHYGINGLYYNDKSTRKRPKIYFMDNVDPDSNTELLNSLDLKKTMFNFITKSGSTSETIENFLLILKLLKQSNIDFMKNIVITTDPEKGFLRKFAKENSISSFSIHPLVGGRFSVLTPVGLLSASVEGIDIDKLICGALKKESEINNTDPLISEAFLLPLIQYNLFKNKKININVLFTYSDGLSYIGDWYAQLLAESIGKEYSRQGEQVFAGITPLSARGTSDQHSILQLFMEGPYDKLIIFLSPYSYRNDENTGTVLNSSDETISYLENKNYTDLIKSEFLATRLSLTRKGRPNATFKVNLLDEFELGSFIYALEYSVLVLGELFNINPINQPAVELGKRYTYGLMGRKGFEKEKAEFFHLAKGKDGFIIK